jgi:hypothetical protein
MEITVLNLNRKFVLLTMTGALLAGGANLSNASVGLPAVNSAASGSTEQQGTIGASQPSPLACPAQVLAIMAEALKQASIADATGVDGKERATGSIPDQTPSTVWGM